MSEEERKRAREEAQKTALLELEEELRQPVKRRKVSFWLTPKEEHAIREFLRDYCLGEICRICRGRYFHE